MNFELYQQFVDGVTSDSSKDIVAFLQRIHELTATGLNVTRFMTSATGLASESGEVAEIMKKVMWHGKPYDDATQTHLRKELGDILWYFTQMCMVLDVSIEDIMDMNVAKLEARYPGGRFSAWYSENRKPGDL